MSNTILVISDDRSTGSELALVLRGISPECEVEFAENRDDVGRSRAPSVILLDLTLSCEPAFDVLRWLRADQRYRAVPVFALGSEILAHDANEAYALGANSCLMRRSAREDFGPLAHGIAAYASLVPANPLQSGGC
jgi:CheY-like chemotaxis protein